MLRELLAPGYSLNSRPIPHPSNAAMLLKSPFSDR